ncbi:MAG: D-alanyl-D-alanine carboxypeptidase [Gammaproteobacteria bacterium]|nr:D-alanyl-D-alanine carboxypeptidase [Gammaproteobacteria bacterium]
MVNAVLLLARRVLFGVMLGIPAVFAAETGSAPAIPSPPEPPAKAYLLMDANSGRVLAERNADERLEPASLTKIMTAYVVFEEVKKGHIKLDDLVTVSEKAWKTEGSRMFAKVGAQISVENLLKGMIVQSGNDASVALAEHVSGDEAVFAQMMNQHAERLGMKNTRYKNSMGLPDPEHYATARDMALLSAALIRDFPNFYEWHSIKEFEFNGIKQPNRNRLLFTDPTVDGVKTGHTKGAGYCLVASALRDNMRLIAVVLGTASDKARAEANRALLDYGYRFYETKSVYKGGEALALARIYKGETKELPVGLAQDFYVTVPRGQFNAVKSTLDVAGLFVAPVRQGDAAGTARATLNDQIVAELPLIALQTVETGGFFRRMADSVALWFK